ncbi:hypothetical protein K437DRAFT_285901 [Tilletiaria anomala UBC 951]|uniref:Uncharacterized protein n=1 Tax=Tilletiaria anomala (strain ATCC 24038 / CBS 436.72 / UBC 951) TaxID=1037660 RepID=A0A066VXE5_TILAU|nr:uncharacterized protein K437DRAFT_285901 [Tilletiaria anomala UBC 951]KDN44953.1 hypothetical protein K437DRAFT_285901 [Tilletiaria anomala UBC 951]
MQIPSQLSQFLLRPILPLGALRESRGEQITYRTSPSPLRHLPHLQLHIIASSRILAVLMPRIGYITTFLSIPLHTPVDSCIHHFERGRDDVPYWLHGWRAEGQRHNHQILPRVTIHDSELSLHTPEKRWLSGVFAHWNMTSRRFTILPTLIRCGTRT